MNTSRTVRSTTDKKSSRESIVYIVSWEVKIERPNHADFYELDVYQVTSICLEYGINAACRPQPNDDKTIYSDVCMLTQRYARILR